MHFAVQMRRDYPGKEIRVFALQKQIELVTGIFTVPGPPFTGVQAGPVDRLAVRRLYVINKLYTRSRLS